MTLIRNKKDIPSVLVLLVLIAILASIYINPQFITSILHNDDKSIDDIIYSDDYKLELTNQEKEWLKTNSTIKIGIDRAFPPFGSITDKHEYVGFSADFMRIIEHRLNINFDYKKNATWNETMQLAQSGQLEVVSALVNTKTRQQFLDFTSPYVENPTVIISDALNTGYIGSLNNLENKTVAIEKGSYAHGELTRKYPEIKILPVINTEVALSMVASKAADAYIGNAITASYLIKKFGYKNLSFSGDTEYSSIHSIGIKKGNKTLLSIFQKTLDSIDISSRDAIKNHWFDMEVKPQISTNTIVKIAATFSTLLVVILAWSFSLRKTKNELKHSQQLILDESEKDHLTGLGNRNKLYKILKQEINRSEKTQICFSLFSLDLDNFKEINESFGHSVGDLLIIESAKRIQHCLSDKDLICRLDGDEFILIIPDCINKDKIDQYGKEIKTSLSNVFYLQENEIYTSVSIGITTFPYDATTSKKLLNNVDQALFYSKKMGKNRFSYFDNTMLRNTVIRNGTINDLRKAIKADQFELHYQPIVDLSTNKITKAEALIRWNHPTRGLIYPDKFISIAEDTGLIIDIGEWVFKKAVSETVKIKEILGDDFQISINTSPLQYGKNGMDVSDWFSHIITSGLSGKDIALEITEGILMESNDTIKNKLYNLRDLDVQISIDDFGTGYSSLSYLKKFDIDYLKIDRTFVSNLSEGSDDLVLIQAIIVMAHKLGCKVIAEGIENEEQRNILSNEGCDFGQGYFYSKPLMSSEFMKMLEYWRDNDEVMNPDLQVIPLNKHIESKSLKSS